MRSVRGKIVKKDFKGKKATETVNVPQIDEAPTASFAGLPTAPDEINKMLANPFVDVDVEMDLFADLAVCRELDAEKEVDMDVDIIVDMGVDMAMSEVKDANVIMAGPKVPSTLLVTVEPVKPRACPGAPSKKIATAPAKIKVARFFTGTGASVKKGSSGFDPALTASGLMEDDHTNSDINMEADEMLPGRTEVMDVDMENTVAVMKEEMAKPTSADLVPDPRTSSTLFGSVVSAVLSESKAVALKEVTRPSICDYFPMDIDSPTTEISVPVPQSPSSSTIQLVPGSCHALNELAVAISVLHLNEEQEEMEEEKGPVPVRGSTITASVKVSPSSPAPRFVPSHLVLPKRHSAKPSLKTINFASEQQAPNTDTPAEKENEIQVEERERRSSRMRFLPDFGRAESRVVGDGCSYLRGRKLNAPAVVPSPPYKTGRYFPAPGSSELPPRTPLVSRKVAEKKIIGKELLWDHTLSPFPMSKQEDFSTLPMRNHKPRHSEEGMKERKERKKKALNTQRAADSQEFVQTLDIFDARRDDLEHDLVINAPFGGLWMYPTLIAVGMVSQFFSYVWL
ncbi:hypothetical protein BDQ12DRAFT_53483 [Crucibulum laeve]|uniref:Uncharacterized protein n=1 Tax=Crucibulum laeve TaxID=68775 RepID=A0A5C3ME12_9AGAR|nr:hypothetical protein BDQ12DRAFT_53483 [Crucibulum laeve]